MKSIYLRMAFIIGIGMVLPNRYVQAQQEYFDGPRTIYYQANPVSPDDNDYNYYYNGSDEENGTWSINGTAATIVSSNAVAATVRTTGYGSFYLTHSNASEGYKEVFIMVYNAPPEPYPPIVVSPPQCGQVTLQMNTEQMIPDVAWYWQTVPNGQSLSLGTSPVLDVSVSQTYYLQARSTVNDVWGETSTGVFVTVPTPAVNGVIASNKTQICVNLNESVEISSSGGVGQPHYFVSTDGGTSWNPLQNNPFKPTSIGTYRFRVRNYVEYCGGYCSTCPDSFVDVVVTGPPATSGELYLTSEPDHNICSGSYVEIGVQNSPGTQYYWISSNADESSNYDTWDMESNYNPGTPFSYQFNTPGNWQIKTEAENSCGRSTVSNKLSLTVWTVPGLPTIASPQDICVGRRAVLNASPASDGIGVKWYSSAAGGVPLNSSPFSGFHQTDPLSAATQFWAATYNAPGCDGPRASITANVNPLPIDSDITANSTTICLGETVHIETSGGFGTTHFWWSTNGGSSWNVFSDEYVGQTGFDHTPTSPGTYRYKVRNSTSCGFCGQDGNNCSYNKYVEVTVYGVADPGPISGPQTVILGKSYAYSLPAATYATSYLWSITNGEIISGQGTANVAVRFSSNNGQLSVVVSNANCGTSEATTVSVRDGLNYIIEEKVLVKNVTNELSVPGLSEDNKNKGTTYYDGLGRPVQTVLWKISPTRTDQVQPVVYDKYSREVKKYLPFTDGSNGLFKDKDAIINGSGDYIGVAQTFYQPGSNIADDPQPTAKTIFEASPLNRVLEQGSPGAAWQPDGNNSYTSSDRTVKYAYESNGSNEVIRWNYIPATGTTPMGVTNTGNFYGANELSKTKVKDEDYHETIEYKDKKGRLVLKKIKAPDNEWADTYYIYDDFGNLVVVLPPEAVKALD